MSFKFFVGQAVEYTPIGEKTAGLYKIVRQMPKEERAFDLRYSSRARPKSTSAMYSNASGVPMYALKVNMRRPSLVCGRARTKHRL
jgi:hypothetical protein